RRVGGRPACAAAHLATGLGQRADHQPGGSEDDLRDLGGGAAGLQRGGARQGA
ncbi:unnamed protein product, partial [Effrenium voratum]